MDFLFEHFSIEEFDKKREVIATERMQEMISKYADGFETETVILHGNPKKAISEYAKKHKAGLIVIGAYGRGEEDGIVFSGSVTMKVVKTSDCPVLIVR